MEHGKVTPEFLTTAVNNFSDTYESIVRFATDHYTTQFERIVQFHKELDDRCIAAGIANFDDQSDTSMKLFEVKFNVWQMTMLRCKDTIAKELDYLRSRCVVEKDEEDPRARFLARVEPVEEEITQPATANMTEMMKESMRYRDEERNELLSISDEHIQLAYEWAKGLKDKIEEDRQAEMSESDLQWIRKKMKEGLSEQNYEDILENGKEEFQQHLEKRAGVMQGAVDASSINCMELIDLSLDSGTQGSAKFIDDLEGAGSEMIDSFERSATEYLGRICARMAAAFLRVGSEQHSLSRSSFTSTKKEMVATLDATVETLRSLLESHADNLNTHRENDRKNVDLMFKAMNASDEETGIMLMQTLVAEYPNIDISPYEKVLVGRGGEGNIYRCNLPGSLIKSDEEIIIVALKKIRCTSDNTELINRSLLKYTNIIQFLGRGIMNDHLYLIMEMCPRSLADIIDKCRKDGTFIGDNDFSKWATELTAGMNYMHDLGICHSDVKPQNLMISANNELKITDFGISLRTDSISAFVKNKFLRGTIRYMAPELHNRKELTDIEMRRSDVWSYGICLWEMLTCKIPFENVRESSVALRISRNDEKSHPPLAQRSQCESLSILILNCWSPELESRWPFYYLLKKIANVKEEIEEGMENDDDYWSRECKLWASAKHEPDFSSATVGRRHSL